MVYLLDDDNLLSISMDQISTSADEPHLWIINFAELQKAGNLLGISEQIIQECLSNKISKFENHDGFDLIILNIPAEIDQLNQPQRICLYLTGKLLLFISDDNQVINDIIKGVEAKEIKNVSLGRILHLFFDRLTFDDSLDLEKIEQEISSLEEELIVSKKNDFFFLVAYRKKLLALKVYYEQLLEIYEAIGQNENGLIDLKELRYFRILTSRANRLYNAVLNLRDYVTQVREAYQTQIDINLNSVMKVFTVITSIFFPLTLIVGWYGMNLKMPEFGWRYGYLFVIGISLATAAITLLYIKKKVVLKICGFGSSVLPFSQNAHQ